MSKRRLIIVLMILSVVFIKIDVNALVEAQINPEWEYYMSLNDEDKNNYLAIPEQYTYEYKRDISFNNSNVFGNSGLVSFIPKQFSLADLMEKIYTNTVSKNQGSLGLCWAFAANGSFESNLLLNGAEGLDSKISKCTSSNPASKYCEYKSDSEQNEKYRNRQTSTNITFSERNIDYILSKPANANAYNSSSLYTIVKEEYNPYSNSSRTIGSGGSFSSAANLYAYGVAPRKILNEWATYDTAMTTMTLEQIYDSVDVDYVVTNYYNYPSKPSDAAAAEQWQNELKSLIMEYGSVYVSTVAPQTSSARACYYYNSNDGTYLINYDANCGEGSLGWHAMQIIGWDDEFSYGYCKTGSTSSGSYTKGTCESAGYEWASGTGAWLLKNSWGSSKTYLYLSYSSKSLSIYGVRGVRVADFDNRYNNVVSNIEYDSSNNTRTYKYFKSDENEYLSHVNVKYSGYNGKSSVYISKDGVNYNLLGSKDIDLPGMFSYSLDNYKLDGNTFYIRIDGNLSISEEPMVFTKNECTYLENCTENVELDTYLQNSYVVYRNDNSISVKTKTRNIKSGAKLQYKVFNEENVDVTDYFSIKNDYVVLSDNIAEFYYSDLETGKYTIRTSYNGVSDDTDFYVIGDDFITLSVKDDLMVTDRTAKVNYSFEINEGISNYRWTSSDETVATINNGTLTILRSGRTTVTLTIATPYGDIYNTIDVVIYDGKISTTSEFLNMFTSANRSKNFLLVKDLNFSGVTYSPSSTSFSGVFNGNNHTIKNINVNKSGYAGLFYSLSGAIVKNLIITDSNFTSTNSYAGAITGYSNSSEIQNVYVDAKVLGASYTGGIVGSASYTNCEQCAFNGTVTSDSSNSSVYVGGIFGRFSYGSIVNSYNKGNISAFSNYNGTSTLFVAGIGNSSSTTSETKIINCYNTGGVTTSSNTSASIDGLSNPEYTSIINSYYLENKSYTGNDEYSRTKAELLTKSNYKAWDFDNIWWFRTDDYPDLRAFPTKITKLELIFPKNIINTNLEYELRYNIEPYGNSEDVVIENLTPNLITIEGNKIVVGKKTGIAKIKLTLNNYEITEEFEIKELITIDYNKEYTNKDLSVVFDINYYGVDTSNGYFELNYEIGENYKTERTTGSSNKININVSENGTLNYVLYYCENECKYIYDGSIEIKVIDRDKPTITYEYNQANKELTISVKDGLSGISRDVEYLYGISSSDTEKPNGILVYQSGVKTKNSEITYKNKYLWIKNVRDNVGNTLCESEYCVYELNVSREKYSVNYYDEDKETILKTDEFYEDDKLVTYEPSKDDDNYYYEFIEWDGYTDGMIVTKNIDLYAKFNKISKKVVSDTYRIDELYIKNIRLKDISDKYYFSEFLNNMHYNEGFDFSGDLLEEENYLKTGMVYSSKYRSYKIVLTGDVTGDGLVRMNDVMKIASHLIDGVTLKDEYFYAADSMLDGNVKMNDLMKIATTIVNGGSL